MEVAVTFSNPHHYSWFKQRKRILVYRGRGLKAASMWALTSMASSSSTSKARSTWTWGNVDILAENTVLTSPFHVQPDCHAFFTVGRHHTSSMESQYVFNLLFIYVGRRGHNRHSLRVIEERKKQKSRTPKTFKILLWVLAVSALHALIGVITKASVNLKRTD